MISKTLCSLQFKTHQNFEDNLNHLIALVSRTPKDSIVLTPEVALTNFCYQRMEEASEFAKKATDTLLKLSLDRTIATTMIEKNKGNFYNNLKVFHKGELIHKQTKTKLFPLGGEHFYFKPGDEREICVFTIENIKYGAINCFELRFTHLWNLVRGADIIFVPAQWGEGRKRHFEVLSEALAITNQCFVLASNGANEKIAKGSGVISPFGVSTRDDESEIVSVEIDFGEIARIRQYLDIGLLGE